MKAVAVFLSGASAVLAGAFIRSCNDDLASALSHSWCGVAPQALAVAHEHCAGCTLMAAGAGLIAVSPLLLTWTQTRTAKARR